MSYETNDKMVSHPDHYKSGKYEVIDIIDEFTKDLSGTEAVCTANAIKYILRWKKKNGIQDVKKAIWYLQHMVDKEEERLIEEPTCSDCTFYEKGNCKFLNMHTMSDHEACGYLDSKNKLNNAGFVNGLKKANEQLAEDFNKKVDMDKIMNRPTEEKKKKFTNNTGEELNIPEFLEKPTDDSKDKQECEYIANLIKNYMNSQKVPTKPLKSMKEICEDIIAPKEPIKFEKEDNNTGFVNGLKKANKQLAEDFNKKVDNIHSCDDCMFKYGDPDMDPCKSCDLHPNPPTNWAARD